MIAMNNRDYIAVHADRNTTYWVIYILSESSTCIEQAKEIVDRCETLFYTFEDFFVIIDFDMNGENTLYRLEQDGDEIGGMWLIEKEVLESADTKGELINKMALLPEDWGVDYNTVVKLDTSEVEAPSRLLVSTAGKMESTTGVIREGGVTQYKRIIQSDANSINGWSVDGPLSDYVNIGK